MASTSTSALLPSLRASQHALRRIRLQQGFQVNKTLRRNGCPRHLSQTCHVQPRSSSTTNHRAQANPSKPLQSLLGGRTTLYTALALLLASSTYFYTTDTRASIHSWLIAPSLRLLIPDAEAGHAFGISALKNAYRLGLHPRERATTSPSTTDPTLTTEILDHPLQSPIAISAGLDKHGEAIAPLFALGPAIVEIGGVTPLPQPGNSVPRVWRIPSHGAIVNRYGLNSVGADAVALNLRSRVRAHADALGYGVGGEAEARVLNDGAVPPGSLEKGKMLAVQIAKNKNTRDGDSAAVVGDYVTCVEKLGRYADIIVVNVSSPNTPGLRSLQKLEPLTNILGAVVDACGKVERRTKPRVMVKVSPDEDTERDIQGICQAVWRSGVDGVIVANTTRSRPVPASPIKSLTKRESKNLQETGGYSGPALFPKTVSLVKQYRRMLDLPLKAQGDATPKVIFASGGITTGRDALEVLNAGAGVAMCYTGLSMRGSGFVTELKGAMREEIRKVGNERRKEIGEGGLLGEASAEQGKKLEG